MLAGMGLMGDVHTISLGMLVNALGRYIHYEKEVAEKGIVTVTEKGNEIQHPRVAMLNKSFDQLKQMCDRFGMSPSAITSVHPAEKKKSGVASRPRQMAQ